jgi:RNA polymerase sigma-70 factor (ECF subfamily)
LNGRPNPLSTFSHAFDIVVGNHRSVGFWRFGPADADVDSRACPVFWLALSLMSFASALPSPATGLWPATTSAPAPAETAFPSDAKPDTKRRTMQDDLSRKQDDELIARTQAGDATAFDELVVKFSPRLYGLVYNMTSNHEDTNDLMQDIWSKAYRSISGFRGKSSFYTWIHSIGVNMTINFLKKRGRRYTLSLDDIDSNVQNDKEFIELTASSTPVREADLSELQKRLNEAMQKLSHDHRAVVTMFDIQGMPHAEIAKILGISEGTVRSRLFYAHRQLQNFLTEFHT